MQMIIDYASGVFSERAFPAEERDRSRSPQRDLREDREPGEASEPAMEPTGRGRSNEEPTGRGRSSSPRRGRATGRMRSRVLSRGRAASARRARPTQLRVWQEATEVEQLSKVLEELEVGMGDALMKIMWGTDEPSQRLVEAAKVPGWNV